MLTSETLADKMPRKRSKSEERERKKAYRQNRTAEKIVLDQEKDRIKKKEAWSRKTEEDKDAENNAKRERMKRLRNETSKEKVDTRTKPRDEQKENRERIRKLRSDQSEEDRKIERDKAKERMVVARAKQTFEEKEDENEKAKERMRDLREKQTMEEREEENEKARVRMEMVRADKGTEACAYERIVKRQEIRNLRKGLSGKEHLEGNLNAKKGMQLLNSVGRLRKFESRDAGMKNSRKRDELFEWKNSCKQLRNTEKSFLKNSQILFLELMRMLDRRKKKSNRKLKIIKRENGSIMEKVGSTIGQEILNQNMIIHMIILPPLPRKN